MMISPDEVRRIAKLARLKLTDEETRLYADQLGKILDYVQKLEEVDVEGVEGMSHAVVVESPFREDGVRASDVREEALAAAPAAEDGHFAVPKIIS